MIGILINVLIGKFLNFMSGITLLQQQSGKGIVMNDCKRNFLSTVSFRAQPKQMIF